METDDRLCIRDLFSADIRQWHTGMVRHLFGPTLADRVLAIPLPVHACSDVREWAPSPQPHTSTVSAFTTPSIAAAWIWRVAALPRVRLFLWKVAWDRLPTRALLCSRGFDLHPLCPVCGLAEESTEHCLLRCSRSRLVWQLAGVTSWESSPDSWLCSFLDTIHRSPPDVATRIVYVAYLLWLSRNRLVFDDILTPVHRLVRQANHMALEALYPRAVTPSLPGLVPWDSPAASAAHPRVLYISWEPPPPGFVKVNFDDSVRGCDGGAGYVIRDPDGRLLAAGGSHLFQPSVPEAELRAAWAGITFAHSNYNF